MEDQATNPSPASAPGASPPPAPAPSTTASAASTPSASQADWPAKVADTIEDVVESVQDRVVRPLILAARGLVFGIIILTMALVLGVVMAIALVRVLDVYAFGGRVWASDAVLGGLLVLGGGFAWTKRAPRGAKEG
jgi:tetrahydromethanopterin S-methyltransferase subunit F